MGDFSFADLNLSNVAPQEARKAGLPEGLHVIKIVDAKVLPEKSRNGYTEVQITGEGVHVDGIVSDRIAVAHNDAEFAKTDKGIVGKNTQGKVVLGGMTNIRSLCEFGGHPNPEKPGDIATLKGLVVGAKVVKEEYQKEGETRRISKFAQYDPFCRPERVTTDPLAGNQGSTQQSNGGSSSSGGSSNSGGGVDDIFG